jgi:hypothetical protein
VRTSIVVGAAAIVVAGLVAVGILVLASKGAAPTETEPSGPVATGIAGGDNVPPQVSAAYDAGSQTATFTWRPATGPDVTGDYFYSFVGTNGRTKTAQTTVTVHTADPATTCITVEAVLKNGKSISDGTATCAGP